jgi:hypothetical protein
MELLAQLDDRQIHQQQTESFIRLIEPLQHDTCYINQTATTRH